MRVFHEGRRTLPLLLAFAIGVAGRPADEGHPYGHGKAEHLAALAEASVLAVVSVVVAALAVARLAGAAEHSVETPWWSFAILGLVAAIDVSRTVASVRGARRYGSPALLSNALHFASDLAGTVAVLAGLARRSGKRGGGPLIGDRLSPLAAIRLGIFGR